MTNKVKITVTALVALNAGEETCAFIDVSDGIHTDSQKHTLLTSQYAELRIKKGEIDRETYEEIVSAVGAKIKEISNEYFTVVTVDRE